MATPMTTASRAWIEPVDCDLDDFRALVATPTDAGDYPLASDVRQGVLVYSAETVATADRTADRHQAMNRANVRDLVRRRSVADEETTWSPVASVRPTGGSAGEPGRPVTSPAPCNPPSTK